MMRLTIIEGDCNAVQALERILGNSEYKICDCAPHTGSSFSQVKRAQPDVVLLGLDKPSPVAAFSDVRDIQQRLDIPVILMSSNVDAKLLRQVQASGSLFLNKPVRRNDVFACLFLALNRSEPGDGIFFCRGSRPEDLHMADSLKKTYSLTSAEVRVVKAMLEEPDVGKTANRLNISPHTVRSHLKRLYAKTGTHRQASLLLELISGPASLRPPIKPQGKPEADCGD